MRNRMESSVDAKREKRDAVDALSDWNRGNYPPSYLLNFVWEGGRPFACASNKAVC
jgi:hypothetical protein